MLASLDNFSELDLRVARIIGVEEHEKARKPMYKITLDIGELGQRTVVAGIKSYYERESLIGKSVICVAGLEPKQIAGVESHGMILAAEDENGVALLTIDREVKPGSAVR
ncbi:MAG: tRNA-binding protein [Candidatus Micrarchaeota archaeon]|nr:tRNA-binding protein [Candidatus Micrarchaeota archaeon]MDE1804377.1 tRNA-binding protein [Candidatus Micrarchaeota archaeon]MDE1846621.1 tRNA-binding protein [Candidatus Micrarchaeota archaeon]